MSLATRCSACGTVFRVVEDQLKVSDGWVRCGRCNTVFDALDGMVDADQLPAEADAAADVPRQHEIDRATAADAEPIDIHRLLARQADVPDEVDDRPSVGEPPTEDRPALRQPLDIDLDDSTSGASHPDPDAFDRQTAAPLPNGRPADAPATGPAPTPKAPASAISSAYLAPAATARPAPSFMHQADRETQWSSPAMRAALIGSSMILLLMLVLQVVYQQRDSIAARSPLAADWLRSACARWNCRIEAPRSIRDVTIENSALTKLAGQPDAARLSLRMRNRSGGDLAMPAVELSLTDFEGRLIARKALLPSDFQIDPPIVAGNSELPVQIIVSAGENRIAGYTVELFYP